MKSALFARTNNDRVVADLDAGIITAIAALRVTIARVPALIERTKREFLLLSDATDNSETHTHSDFGSTRAFHARVCRNIANSFHRQHRERRRRVRRLPFDAQAVKHNVMDIGNATNRRSDQP
jgi:hypothetical protein